MNHISVTISEMYNTAPLLSIALMKHSVIMIQSHQWLKKRYFSFLKSKYYFLLLTCNFLFISFLDLSIGIISMSFKNKKISHRALYLPVGKVQWLPPLLTARWEFQVFSIAKIFLRKKELNEIRHSFLSWRILYSFSMWKIVSLLLR